MLFNSFEFIFIFLTCVLSIYYYAISKFWKKKYLKIIIIISSLIFYSWWKFTNLYIILFSVTFNFFIGKILLSTHKKKFTLFLGILFNISLIGYYKYKNFFIENYNLTFNSAIEIEKFLIPLGISFFTFQGIAYLVDVYNSKIKKIDFIDFSYIVLFFPHQIAGPIVLYNKVVNQLTNNNLSTVKYDNITSGIFLFFLGLFKKTVIADQFGHYATLGFDKSSTLNFVEAWHTSLSYTFQIYFDFSGYSDMALGLALLFNIKLIQNFNSPYKSLNIQEFWRRWHISLSIFIRDYLYKMLGGSRKGFLRTLINILITFLLCGLWHGASWTFILWGALHGLALITYKIWKLLKVKIHSYISWIITFTFINFSWVIFRADNWEDAKKILKGMTGQNGILVPEYLKDLLSKFSVIDFQYGVSFFKNTEGSKFTILLIISTLIITLFAKNSNELNKIKKIDMKWSIIVGFVIFYSIISINKNQPFLYFNF